MKHAILFLLCVGLAGATSGAAEPPAAPPAARKAAPEKTVWADGLQEPHGMTLDGDGNVVVTEYKSGRVVRFSPDGRPLGVVADNVKSPAWVTAAGKALYVTERKANRVLRVEGGKVEPLPQAVEEPLGVAFAPKSGRLYVVSHTTSRVFAVPSAATTPGAMEPVYAPAGGKRYGLRCAAVAQDGSVYLSDETDGRILKLSPDGGQAETWVQGLDDPAGLVAGPDGALYVADEGAGKVFRIGADRKPVAIAEGFRKPRGLVFLADGALLVAERPTGTVYRVAVSR